MKRYIPTDLSFEHYSRLNHRLLAAEYCKVCAEMCKPRYASVPLYEALCLFEQEELCLPEQVRVIWVHDIERPSDNYLAREMAEMEHDFGFQSTYNIRTICTATAELRQELQAITDLGHEIQYQYEDLLITEGDIPAARLSFRDNLAKLREYFPEIKTAFAHGVYKSDCDSTDIFKEDGAWEPKIWQGLGLQHQYGELYYFMSVLKREFGPAFHYLAESSCIGGEEFAEALRSAQEGDVVVFLQHPTWWSDSYDVAELKKVIRGKCFF